MYRHLVARAGVAALLILGVFPTASQAAPSSACPVNVVPRDPGWTTIEVPEFANLQNPATPSDVVGARRIAAVPTDPATMFVSSARELFRTKDGGCTWSKVFATPQSPFLDCAYYDDLDDWASPGCGHIYDIDVLSEQTIFVQARTASVLSVDAMTTVFVSRDGGDTWNLLEVSGTPTAPGDGPLVVGADGKTIYVFRGIDNKTTDELYVSRDAGDTWSVRAAPTAATGEAPSSYTTPDGEPQVSTLDPRRLWAAGEKTDLTTNSRTWALLESTDAGQTWRAIYVPTQGFGDFDVFESPHGPPRILLPSAEKLVYSLDGGSTWAETGSGYVGGEGFARAFFTGKGMWVFVLGANNLVLRIDLKRDFAVALKTRPYGWQYDDQSALRPYHYVPGQGIYLLGSCYQDCSLVLRYAGKGV